MMALKNSEIGTCGDLLSCALSLVSLSIVFPILFRLYPIHSLIFFCIYWRVCCNIQYKSARRTYIIFSICICFKLLFISTIFGSIGYDINEICTIYQQIGSINCYLCSLLMVDFMYFYNYNLASRAFVAVNVS